MNCGEIPKKKTSDFLDPEMAIDEKTLRFGVRIKVWSPNPEILDDVMICYDVVHLKSPTRSSPLEAASANAKSAAFVPDIGKNSKRHGTWR